MSHGSLPYAQVRMQARLGRRPSETDLRRLRAAGDLAACLQQVRASPWARHAGQLAPGMDAHEVDRRLRAQWRATVADVARWLPHAWQPSVRWLEWLPWLPALQKLARGGRPSNWMRDDPVLGPIVAGAVPVVTAGGAASTGPRPMAVAVAAHDDVPAAWLAHWRGLWPAGDNGRRAVQSVFVAVDRAVRALRATGAAPATAAAFDDLRKALLRAFRRHPLSPAGAMAYLGLEAVDLLELRGAVAQRAALPTGVA